MAEEYEWRKHWQPKLRGGMEVLTVFEDRQGGFVGVYNTGTDRGAGRWMSDGKEFYDGGRDLLPIEAPKTLHPWPDLSAMIATTGPLERVWFLEKSRLGNCYWKIQAVRFRDEILLR